nr:hypothetical protein [Desulfobulbaceae bacterium]
MLENQKLSSKLILGFAIPILAIILIIGMTYFYVNLTSASVTEAKSSSEKSFEFAMLAQKMRLDVVQVQQWLTDISATRGLDGLDDGFSEAEKRRASFQNGLNKFQDLYRSKNDAKNLQVITEIKNAFEAYYLTGKTMAEAYIEEGPTGGNKMMAGFDQASAALAEKFDPLIQQQGLQGAQGLELVKGKLAELGKLTLVIGMLCIVVCVLCTW